MVCEIISGVQSFSDMLVYPTSCDYFFYLKILFAIMAVVAWAILRAEKEEGSKGDFLGALAISSIAITLLAVVGTLIQSTAGIPMIQADILMYILAVTIPLTLIWIFRGQSL